MQMIPLSGKNIRLRAIEPADLDVIYTWENDPGNWLISNTITPFSKHVLTRYIQHAHKDLFEARQLRLMIDLLDDSGHTRETIGTVDMFDYDPVHRRAGMGILIASKENRMKGYASESLSILIRYAFGTLHLHQLYCNVSLDNQASLKLFKKLGFKEIGVKRDWLRYGEGWLDVCLLQLVRSG
jgi:diamine N-acetyltransferase